MELPQDVLEKIAVFVGDPKDIVVSFAGVCSSWNKAAREPCVWQELAHFKYGQGLAEQSGLLYGGDWKALMIDDNKIGAPLLTLPGPPLVCNYVKNRLSYYFCCIVQCVKLHRMLNELRVYIDVRGEFDLRRPMQSSIWSGMIQTRFNLPTPRGDNRVHCIRPDRFVSDLPMLVEDYRRMRAQHYKHYKGYLVFPAAHFYDGGTYSFCYANVQQDMHPVDYHPVDLFTIPSEGGLQSVFANNSKVNSPFCYSADMSPFRDDTPDVERTRWTKIVPEQVMARSDWYV